MAVAAYLTVGVIVAAWGSTLKRAPFDAEDYWICAFWFALWPLVLPLIAIAAVGWALDCTLCPGCMSPLRWWQRTVMEVLYPLPGQPRKFHLACYDSYRVGLAAPRHTFSIDGIDVKGTL